MQGRRARRAEVAFSQGAAGPAPAAVRPENKHYRLTIEARYGHPRTPRDGFASAGANGAPYSARAAAGVAGCRPATAFPEQGVGLSFPPCASLLLAAADSRAGRPGASMPMYRPLEDLTATLLQRLLGRYITGLEGRNLRVAVWSGRVVLENLHLRPDALIGLLPVGVRAGFVGRIEMSVPWHKLGSSPVTLELHDVFVLAMPLNEAGIAAAQA